MAKFENELDLAAARRSVLKQQKKIDDMVAGDKNLAKIAQTLVADKKIICYIFAKSVAFRIGKSSVKSIPGYGTGFKTSFPGNNTSKTTFAPYNFSIATTAVAKVILMAAWFLIHHQDRVKSESDKTEAVESEQVAATQSQLKALIKEHGVIRLMVGDKLYDVDDFAQVSGRPKADMVFKFKKQDVIFVSHKKGSKPGDFQQYGGFAKDLEIKERSDAKQYKSIFKFLNEVDDILEALGVGKDAHGRFDLNNLKKGGNFAKLIDDPVVANTVMFGKDYSTGKLGLDNCSILIDGDIEFKPVKGTGVFSLRGTFHTTVNPVLLKNKPAGKPDPNDIYSPAMFLMKSEAQGLNQAGFANVRATIWPNNDVIKSYRKKFDDVYRAVKSNNTAVIKKYREDMVK